ncbi:hypothetical protein ABID53_002494 [Bacillus oleivorans]
MFRPFTWVPAHLIRVSSTRLSGFLL